MVEHVEGVHAELEVMRLGYRERFLNRDVPVLLIGRTKRIARRGAPAGSSGVCSAVNGGKPGDRLSARTGKFLAHSESAMRGLPSRDHGAFGFLCKFMDSITRIARHDRRRDCGSRLVITDASGHTGARPDPRISKLWMCLAGLARIYCEAKDRRCRVNPRTSERDPEDQDDAASLAAVTGAGSS